MINYKNIDQGSQEDSRGQVCDFSRRRYRNGSKKKFHCVFDFHNAFIFWLCDHSAQNTDGLGIVAAWDTGVL